MPTTARRKRPDPPSASASPRLKVASPSPAQLAYFVIFNPKLAAKKREPKEPEPEPEREAEPGGEGEKREKEDVDGKGMAESGELGLGIGDVSGKGETQGQTEGEGGGEKAEALQRDGAEREADDSESGAKSAAAEDGPISTQQAEDSTPSIPASSTAPEGQAALTDPSQTVEPARAYEHAPDATTASPPGDEAVPDTVAAPLPPPPSSPPSEPAVPTTQRVDPGNRDRDLEEDLREATQIVFYTSRDAGGVSRDTMLRQVGLAKGLMGFSDMVDPSSDPFWAVHSQNTRLIIYTPEPDWYIYICVTLGLVQVDAKKDEVTPSQGISDRMLVDGLQRGYDDYVLLNGTFGSNLGTRAQLSQLEKYWTRFAFSFESGLINPAQPGLMAWLGGFAPQPAPPMDTTPLETFATENLAPGSGIGMLGRDRVLAGTGAVPAAEREQAALTRFLLTLLHSQLPTEQDPPPALKGMSDRQTLGFGFGRRRGHGKEKSTGGEKDKDKDVVPPSPVPKDAQSPATDATAKEKAPDDKDERKPSWGPLAWVGLGSTPSSRAVTPSPMERKPTSASSEAPPRRAVSHSHTSSTASVSSLRKWNFGDVMGNMGAALGLSPAPSPRVPEFKSEDKGEGAGKTGEDGKSVSAEDKDAADKVAVADKEQPAQDASATPSDPTSAQTESTPSTEPTTASEPTSASQSTPHVDDTSVAGSYDTPAAMLGTSVQSNYVHAGVEGDGGADSGLDDVDVSRTPTPGPETALPEEVERTPTPSHPEQPEQPEAETPPAVTADIPSDPVIDLTDLEPAVDPLETPTAERPAGGPNVDADDTTPTPTASAPPLPTLTPETARGVLPALAAASDDRVDVTWSSKGVYVENTKRRLAWVVRDAALLYTLAATGEPHEAPSGRGTVDVFDAFLALTPLPSGAPASLSPSTGKNTPSTDDTTIHHHGSITDRSGKLHGADGVLAALRDVIVAPTGPGEVYAQLATGRFVVAKKADNGGDGELFVVTARKEASLTDAERAVRGYAFVRPEFS